MQMNLKEEEEDPEMIRLKRSQKHALYQNKMCENLLKRKHPILYANVHIWRRGKKCWINRPIYSAQKNFEAFSDPGKGKKNHSKEEKKTEFWDTWRQLK